MPKKLKIVYLPVYYDNAYQLLLMEQLRKRGHEVINGGGGGYFLRTCLFKWKPDILHLHWTHPYMIQPNIVKTWIRSFLFILELKIIQKRGTKVVWTVHNLISHDSKYPNLEKFFLKILARILNSIIVHGNSARSMIIEQLNIKNIDKISIIPHGNYIGYYPDEVTKEQARDELNINKHSFVFLFFGQIHPYKGVLELIDAFHKLEQKDLVLIIAGAIKSDELREKLDKRVSLDKRIKLYLGYIEDDKIQYYLRASDLVVLPYRDVLTSGTLILAMGFGRCCLVPDIGILAEVIGDDGGILYKYNQEESLTNALKKVLANSSLIHEKNKVAYNRVKKFTFSEVSKITEQVYITL